MDSMEISFNGDLQRLQPQPGDVFVLSTDRALSKEQVGWLLEYWRGAMGDAKVLVLDNGMELGVASPSDSPATTTMNGVPVVITERKNPPGLVRSIARAIWGS